MKYQPPYGITDPNAPYINGNPAAGIQGSIPPAAAFEYPMREIVAAISANGWTPSDADLQQLAEAIRSQGANYLVDTGAVNALVVAANPILHAYTPGLPLRVKVGHSNISDGTHTTLTLDAGAGAANVVMPDGTLPPSGTLSSGGVTTFVFDGARWQIQNLATNPGTGGGTNTQTLTKIPYCDDSGTASNAIRALYAPPITSITEGDFLSVKLAFPLINGAATITVNALPAKPVTRVDGTNPQTGDAAAGQIMLLCFDGVRFQIVSVTGSPLTLDAPIRSLFAQVSQMIPTGQVLTYFTGWATKHNSFPAGNPMGPDFFVAPTTGVYLVAYHEFNDIPSGIWCNVFQYDAANNPVNGYPTGGPTGAPLLGVVAASGINAGNISTGVPVPLQANAQAIFGLWMNATEKLRFAVQHNSNRGTELCTGILWIGKVS